jgi:hypothetical protein
VGGSAPLCEACSNDIHQTTSARHNIKTIISEPAHSIKQRGTICLLQGGIDDSGVKPDMVEK